MSNIWIKICGITRKQDALDAAALGADALGLNMYPPSPRAINPDSLAELLADLPESVNRVALFVNPERSEVNRVIETGMVDCLQFHGDESSDFCESFGLPYMKALRVHAESDLHSLVDAYASATYILLDAFDKKVPGGTGKTFDWDLAESLRGRDEIKLVLAGGLNPDNVREAVERLNPFGVDVSSGVESSPGIKDFEKMKQFIEGARSV